MRGGLLVDQLNAGTIDFGSYVDACKRSGQCCKVGCPSPADSYQQEIVPNTHFSFEVPFCNKHLNEYRAKVDVFMATGQEAIGTEA